MAERRVVIAGELDLSRVAELRAELRDVVIGSDAHVVVDCARMTFVDSTGIAVLLEAHALLQTRGRRMLIANVRPRLRRAFEVLGVDDLLTFDRVPPQCRRANGRPIRAPIV
jgi:anti-anti-sigma factor